MYTFAHGHAHKCSQEYAQPHTHTRGHMHTQSTHNKIHISGVHISPYNGVDPVRFSLAVPSTGVQCSLEPGYVPNIHFSQHTRTRTHTLNHQLLNTWTSRLASNNGSIMHAYIPSLFLSPLSVCLFLAHKERERHGYKTV